MLLCVFRFGILAFEAVERDVQRLVTLPKETRSERKIAAAREPSMKCSSLITRHFLSAGGLTLIWSE